MVIPHANNERNRALGNGAQVPDFGPYATEDWPDQDKGHAAMITRMDSYLGRLLDHLELLGLAEHSLVLFPSALGPPNERSHTLVRFLASGPFSGFKRSLRDGGFRVPTIAWWPGRVKAGVESGHVGYFGDWFATAMELAGAEVPSGLDSISFAPELLGRTTEQKQHEFLYWEFHERGFQQAALYQGRWKGLRSGGPDAPVRVFDLRNDPAEKTDVASRRPEIAAKLAAYLKTARTDAPNWPARW
jgi:arylsulfatase A-like enzyme